MSKIKEPIVNETLARDHGLSADEFARVKQILGRDPTYTELGIFSVMWSEHCSYKSSRVYLKGLPTTGDRVIQGPGENAGVVAIGDGQAIVFKMESHNHPSFIEPYQGAATGVGGICRDVFTMGARPIALADSLRFGGPGHPRTKTLVHGVVAGIGGYGNSFGVPTVAGDVSFDECYDGNILVNAFCLGLVDADRIFKGTAAGVGNPVMYVGAKTGRDGIHGATMASAEFSEVSAEPSGGPQPALPDGGAATARSRPSIEEKRPTVQVGDPFMEKLLLEACLELMRSDALVGIQDMGAAGLTSSSVEMAARAGNGVELWLEKVPVRETGMTPYELMLSESQERMLMVVKQGREQEALRVFDKWDLDAAVIGKVTDTGRVVVTMHGETYADLPAAPLAEGLKYDRPRAEPTYLKTTRAFDPTKLAAPDDLTKAFLDVLSSPNVASKEWVYRQYDHNVRHGTVIRPGAADAGVVRVIAGRKEKGIAITTGCNARFVYLDPYEGGKLAVIEEVCNLIAVGARPLATTDCLNFGNPEKPEIMWQFAEAVRGMGEACAELEAPIVSGNVSFYNETDGKAIFPTPMIGMVGLLDEARRATSQFFRHVGDVVAVVGVTLNELGGSEYLKRIHGLVSGRPPEVDFERIKFQLAGMLRLHEEGILRSAHDVSEGGLVCALAECCVSGPEPIGLAAMIPANELRPHEVLFTESPARFVITLDERDVETARLAVTDAYGTFMVIGSVGGDRFTVRTGDEEIDLPLSDVIAAWRGGFTRVAD